MILSTSADFSGKLGFSSSMIIPFEDVSDF